MDFRSKRPKVNWPMTPDGYYIITGTRRQGGPFPQTPGPTFARPKEPWRPPLPKPAQIDIALRIFQRRAVEQAQRQAEQARSRERAEREARERAAREHQREEQQRRLREELQRQQREQQQRQRELQGQQLRRERERTQQLHELEERRRTQHGTFLGTALAGMVPPGLRSYAMRRPPEFLNVQGPELVMKQAERAAADVKLGMENFSFWITQAASVIAGVVGMPGEYMAIVGTTKALQEITGQVNRLVSSSAAKLSNTVGRAATSTAPKSIDNVLMECRNEAYRITAKLAQQDLAEGTTIAPTRFGEIVDAIFKSLVQHARRNGLLPQTIRTAPPPLAISGSRLPRGGAIDAWDSATGIGWDVTTATVRSVAGHERYINRAMPDGTRIRDVRPLVYPRSNTRRSNTR
jgi:hypothetical protein